MTISRHSDSRGRHAPGTAVTAPVNDTSLGAVAATPSPPEWLRDIRRKLGWSQQELASRIFSNYAVISRIENGKKPLSAGMKWRIESAVRDAEMGR